ncbi:MAG: HD domain-containing phosphohydrolase [Alphaproteobacteria bacterium]
MQAGGFYRAFLRAGLPFILLSGGYVLLGDWLVGRLTSNPDTILSLGIAKGLFFVGAVALALTLVTARLMGREVEDRRRLSEEMARKGGIFEALPGPAFAFDDKARLVAWNRQVLTATGLPAEAVVGRSAEDFIHPDDRESIRTSLQRILKGGETRMTPARLLIADGTAVPYLWSGTPLRGEDGTILGAVGFGQNIGKEPRAAEVLRIHAAQTEQLLFQIVGAMTLAMEARDAYTAGHQDKVAQLAVRIGERLNLTEDRLHALNLAAHVHDVGKLAVPTDILTLPRRLTAPEMAIVQTHADWGYRIMRQVEFPWPLADIVHQHHERMDGSGYPEGLAGDAILLEARILAVADVADSMMSHRPYRPALGQSATVDELRRGAGSTYDPAVVEACLAVFADGFVFHPPLPSALTGAAA